MLLPSGIVGHLIYWPPPPDEARNLLPKGIRRRRGRGSNRARVMLDGGATITVPIDKLTIMEAPNGT